MKGVVAAGHEITASAAAEMLKAGGNAFDAVLAGIAAACVPEVVLASLGGGGFLMARRGDTGETVLYDFFAQTPRRKRSLDEIDFHAIHADFGPATQEFHIGAGATATPGLIPGLFAVNRDLGTLPLGEIFAPAIEAARNGVTVSSFNAYLFTVIEPILTASDSAKALFAPKGALLTAGEIFRNPAYGETLEALARNGERLFREGELGQQIAHQSADAGGHLTLADLAGYQVKRRAPLQQYYRGHLCHLNPAPSAGGPLIGFSLGLLQHLCASEAPQLTDLVEAMALTNAARSRRACSLEEFAAEAHVLAHLATARKHKTVSRGTTHISVIDAEGNAAAATISNGEGNGLMLADTGIMLNNMLGEEDLHDHGFHNWPLDERLSSMMSPTIIEGPDASMTALGSGGSNRIRGAILQVASGLIDHGFSLEEAVCAPRLHVEKCGTVSFEASPDRAPFTPDAKETLLARHADAHAWPEPNMFFGGVHSVRRLADGHIEGAGDPRRSGVAITVSR